MACGQRMPVSAVASPPTSSPVSSPGTRASSSPAPETVSSAAQHQASTGGTIGQMGNAGTVPFSVWGPFAGYGTRGRHVSWLLNDHGPQAEGLRDAVMARFQRRQVPNARVLPVTLQRQGIAVDTRPYFFIRRGNTTVGLYIARFGQDLYVSQVTYFKGLISNLRAILVAVMAMFLVVFPIWLLNASQAVGVDVFGGGIVGLGSMAFVLCCGGPIGLLATLGFVILVPFSIYKWLTEKDILAALRVAPNEFDTDDLVALEKSVEQTVRESLDAVGIEQRLMPPAEEYGMRRRLF